MEIIAAVYLIIAGCLAASKADGIIKDTTTVDTYKFEVNSAQSAGDQLTADYLQARLERFQKREAELASNQ